MKKDAYYFPHFCNARHDRKLKRVQKELGVEGYGIYFMLLEVLREQTDFRYPMGDVDLLADEFGTSVPKVEAVICNYKLFEVDSSQKFFSSKLVLYIQPYIERTEKARFAARVRWDKVKNANAMLEHSGCTAREELEQCQGEERKGEERKGKESIPPEIKNFVSDYQEYVFKTFGASAPKVTDSLISKGSDIIDKLMRLDGFTYADVSGAIEWASRDDFWAKQIKSLAGLRSKSKNQLTKFQNLFDSYQRKSRSTGSEITDHNMAAAREFLNG